MKKLLVIDDAKYTFDRLQGDLQGECKILSTTLSENDIFETIKTEMPDAVLLSWVFQNTLTGEGILQRIKKDFPKIIVIMMAGIEDVRELLLSKGADEVLQKPVGSEALRLVLKTKFENIVAKNKA